MFSTKTHITHMTSLLRRASVLTAIATASLAFAAASTASAEQSKNSDGKKSCTLQTGNGLSITIDDGKKLTITTESGHKSTVECKDGKFVEVRSVTVLPPTPPVSAIQGSPQEGGSLPSVQGIKAISSPRLAR